MVAVVSAFKQFARATVDSVKRQIAAIDFHYKNRLRTAYKPIVTVDGIVYVKPNVFHTRKVKPKYIAFFVTCHNFLLLFSPAA